jgi:hypothetical protein
MLLTDNLVYLQFAGIFGWAGTPAVFQVVTRAIQWELRHTLTSSTIMYVDDIVGVCMASDVTEDLRRTRDVCTNLLGPSAVADDKTECGRRMVRPSGHADEGKASLVCLLLHHQHLKGLRGKAATSALAGLRLHFAKNLQSTAYLDTAVISTARQACSLTPEELRAKRDAGAPTSVKLPACEDMLVNIRTRMWTGQAWSDQELINRMTYIACMFGFDQSGRISEYTAAERNHEDHCVRVDDLTYYVRSSDETVTCAVGSVIARRLAGIADDSPLIPRIVESRVQTASAKGKVIAKAKVVARRSEEESQFLDHLIL